MMCAFIHVEPGQILYHNGSFSNGGENNDTELLVC